MTDLGVPGVRLHDLEVHRDSRGFFTELFRADQYEDVYVQANRSRSDAGVLRGLHYHRLQADLWHVVSGEALVVLADLRSPDRRPLTATIRLSGDVPQSLYIPPGVAHGYKAVEAVELIYWVTREFDASDEFGIAWDDPTIGVDWGPGQPILSERDATNPRLEWELLQEF